MRWKKFSMMIDCQPSFISEYRCAPAQNEMYLQHISETGMYVHKTNLAFFSFSPFTCLGNVARSRLSYYLHSRPTARACPHTIISESLVRDYVTVEIQSESKGCLQQPWNTGSDDIRRWLFNTLAHTLTLTLVVRI